MLFSRIVLTNWKNFRAVDVILNKRIFVLGANASGKSNFLDSFRFLSDVAKKGLAYAVESRGGISHIRCLSARNNPDITISVHIDDYWKYSLTFGGRKGGVPLVKSEVVTRKSESRRLKRILARPDSDDKSDKERLTQTALEQVNANKDFREIANFLKDVSYKHIIPQVVRDPQGFTPIPVKDDPYGRDLVSKIWNTSERIRTSRLKKINEALTIAVPQLNKLEVKMNQSTGMPHLIATYQHWRLHGAKQDEASFSDGTIRLLALLWTLLESGGTLILEEPELSLHDEVVKYLPTMFANLDRKKKQTTRQVFVSTHSKVLLSDPGIGAGEVLLLQPGENGTEIVCPDEVEEELMKGGLTAAEVLQPKTSPNNVVQLSLF